jgi:dTDP-4-amino-4,6-dideoxygalactose transaminase
VIPLADLRSQFASIAPEIRAALDGLFEVQEFVLGSRVASFERSLAEFLEVPHAVGVKSGSDALLLALIALGVGPGDEVVTTPFSFFATAGSIVRAGATPVFVDVRPDTLNLDPRAVSAALGPRTRAILAVHLFGQPAELDELLVLANARGIALVEDAAQALGATYQGRRVGGIGHVGCLSFHPSKPLGAFGDAGAVVTRDAELAVRLARLRTHGSLEKHRHELARGGNHRLDALQAAVLSVKLPRLSGWLAARRALAAYYRRELEGLDGLALPPRVPGTESSESVYTLRVEAGRRDGLRRHLHASGVASAVHYPKPIHLQPACEALGYGPGSFPIAEAASREVLSIPIFPELTVEDREQVVRAVKSYFVTAGDARAALGATP